ncbi:MAG: diguanylate cyclase [Desulfobacterium sp.]|nr:diguanylate cyclase [Desulfobacterium sp.]
MKIFKLKYHILIPLMLALAIFLISFVYIFQIFHKDYVINDVFNNIQSLHNLFTLQIESDAHLMCAALKVVSKDKEIKKALIKKDRAELFNITKSLFEELKEDFRITHFYFTGPDRINILRVNKPDKYGDITNRFTTINAEKTGKQFSGIELGTFGTFALRAVMPWYEDKKLIGFVELAEEIDSITQKFNKIFGLDIYILINKQYLDRKHWETGMKMLGREARWDRFPSVVIIDQTSKVFPDKLATNFIDKDGAPGTSNVEVTFNNRNYYSKYFPVTDAGNRLIGTMVIVRDITDLKMHHKITIAIVTAICIVLAIILFAIFYRFLGGVEKQIESENIELLRINKVVESTSDAIILADISGKAVYSNNAFLELFGYTTEELNRLGGPSILHADYKTAKEVYNSIIQGNSWKGEVKMKTRDNDLLNILLRADHISDEKGNIIDLMMLYTNITENKQCETAIIENEEMFSTITSIANDAVIMMNDNGAISYWNAAAEKILGYTSEEVLGKNLHKLLSPEKFHAAFLKGFTKFKITGKGNAIGKTLELEAVRKGGDEFPIELSLSSVKLKGKWLAVGIIRDITDRKKLEEELKKLSYLDGLTGVANRRHLDEVIEFEWKRMMRESKPVSMIMGDIDYFKAYNDTYGHQKGDDCLKKVANTLKIVVKRPADLVARYGGEEFAVLLPGIDEKGADNIADKMRSKIEALGINHSGSQNCSVVTMSFGVSTIIPATDNNTTDLIKTADYALYKAKKEGRNRVVIYGK